MVRRAHLCFITKIRMEKTLNLEAKLEDQGFVVKVLNNGFSPLEQLGIASIFNDRILTELKNPEKLLDTAPTPVIEETTPIVEG